MLKADSISCTLGTTKALKDVSLQIGKKDFLAIVGPNGSGKTTLLRCLLNLTAFSGEVKLQQKNIKEYSRKDIALRLGYVPQANTKLQDFSVEQFVSMGRYAHRNKFFGSSKKDAVAIEHALALTETTAFRKRLLTKLSGGEKQRVLLAATLAQEPEIILLDEPTSFLDPKHEEELYQTLKTVHEEEKRGICIVSHNINSAATRCNRILALKSGELIFDGKAAQFMDTQLLSTIYETEFSILTCPDSGDKIALTRGSRNVRS